MERKKTVRLSVKVHPKSRKQEIIEIGENAYKIHVLAPPSKGEANAEVCKLIARYLDIPVSRVKVLRGHKSRNKIISIDPD
jgi:uncharacterized protein (TIGR00251 family)